MGMGYVDVNSMFMNIPYNKVCDIWLQNYNPDLNWNDDDVGIQAIHDKLPSANKSYEHEYENSNLNSNSNEDKSSAIDTVDIPQAMVELYIQHINPGLHDDETNATPTPTSTSTSFDVSESETMKICKYIRTSTDT